MAPLDRTQASIGYWPTWLLFLHLWPFPWKLFYLTARQVMDLVSPCSPGSQSGPAASLSEGPQAATQRTSQRLLAEHLR